MNSLERVSLALQHKEADRVPVYPLVNSIARKTVNATYDQLALDPELCARAYINITEQLGLDVICTLTDLSVEAADFGAKLIYPKEDAAYPDDKHRVIKTTDDYDKIKAIDVKSGKRMMDHVKLCRLLMDAKGHDTPVVAFVFGPLGILSMLRGQEQMFMDLVLETEKIHKAMEEITKTLIEYCDLILETGVHAIMFDTLFASQSILSNEMWDDIEGPYVERLAKHIHDKGTMVMIHNCGNGIYFDSQIKRMKPEAISFLHVPADCKDFTECKEKYGHLTTLIGCIDPCSLMTSSIDDVVSQCQKTIDLFKKDGGFILATGCEYPASLDFELAEVICNTGKTYGKY
ncbi:MAG: uroporphyrinogen decarboxylase family protein [Peptostreptococcaceae bacterium]|nr:uroporphyrinogen decarboxylase family protein [Peptostreptococcaceae bacterium]